MSDILEEFNSYISTNKAILEAMPTKTKKNMEKYVAKLKEFHGASLKIKDIVWRTIEKRYVKLTTFEDNKAIAELENKISEIGNVELFNELNTPYEKLGFDRIDHNLSQFYEANLELLNENIKSFIDKFKSLGIELTEEDFKYSNYVIQYMTTFFEAYNTNNFKLDKLKRKFEEVYWKCPDLVTHIELNLRYLYNYFSKQIEKDLTEKNNSFLAINGTDKNGLVKKYFDLNKELIKEKSIDPKTIMDKFINGEWKIKDFNERSMQVLFDKLYRKGYDKLPEKDQIEVNKNFARLLNTLREYDTYKHYKFIISDLKEKAKNKDAYKGVYDQKKKELRKKEVELLHENEQNRKIARRIQNPIFKLFKKKWEKKIYDFPVASNLKIKELKELYDEVDDELVNTRIVEFVDDTCSLKYIFKIANSFYNYTYKLIKKHFEDDPDVDVDEEFERLQAFIDQPYKVMLNNIKSIEEPEITSIVSNRYKILNINLEKEDIEENLETLLSDTEKIVNYNNIKRSGLSFSDIEFVEKVNGMRGKK